MRKILPYDVIQILTESDDGIITTMAWALPDGLEEYWRKELIRIHGNPGAENILTPEGAENLLSAGNAMLDNNSMMLFVNDEYSF